MANEKEDLAILFLGGTSCRNNGNTASTNKVAPVALNTSQILRHKHIVMVLRDKSFSLNIWQPMYRDSCKCCSVC